MKGSLDRLRRGFAKWRRRILRIPHLFSKVVVIWCILVATAASAAAMFVLYRTGADSASLLAVILSFFGGELLVLCLNRIVQTKREVDYDSNRTCM